MTTREMISKLWDLAGQPSDLYPYQGDVQGVAEIDLASEGTQKFLQWMSQGQIALVNGKRKDLRFMRFRKFYIEKNLKLGVNKDHEFTVTRQSEYEFRIDPTQANFVLDLSTFENALLVRGSSTYKIMSVTEISPTLWVFYVYPDMAESAEDNDVAGSDDPVYPQTLDEITFALNQFNVYTDGVGTDNYRVDLPELSYAILRIDDYETNTQIERAVNKEDLATQSEAFSVGTPTKFYDIGGKLYFDYALDDFHWYRFEIFQQPADITDLDQEIAIPLPYHQALLLWCLWQIALYERSEINATNYKRLYNDEILTVRDEYDNDFERAKSYGLRVRRS